MCDPCAQKSHVKSYWGIHLYINNQVVCVLWLLFRTKLCSFRYLWDHISYQRTYIHMHTYTHTRVCEDVWMYVVCVETVSPPVRHEQWSIICLVVALTLRYVGCLLFKTRLLSLNENLLRNCSKLHPFVKWVLGIWEGFFGWNFFVALDEIRSPLWEEPEVFLNLQCLYLIHSFSCIF